MPPQVIDLLSSPQHSSPSLPTRQRPASRSSKHAPPTALSDEIDSSLLEYLDYDTPVTKKRRLSPPAEKSVATRGPFNTAQQHTAPVRPKDSATIVLSDDDRIQPHNQSTQFKRGDDKLIIPGPWNDDLSDPILCSSSAPELLRPGDGNKALRKESGKKGTDHGIMSLDDSIVDLEEELSLGRVDDDELPTFSQQSASQMHLSSQTAALLASIKNRPGSSSAPAPPVLKGAPGRPRARRNDLPSEELSGEDGHGHARGKQKRTDKTTSSDKSAKALEREQAKLRKEQQKAEEKERKQKLKEEKQKQKQLAADIAEVNKSKMDKKVSTPEMIVDLAESLQDTSVANQVGEFMKHLGVETKFVPTELTNIVSWRRKVTAQYNEEAGHWEPCALTVKREKHVLCFLSAQQFVELAVGDENSSDQSSSGLENHVLNLLRCFPNCKPIYLIEGLTSWMKKNQNSRNRAYQAAVRRQFNGEQNENSSTSNAGRKSRKPNAPPPVDDDTVEDALIQLQVNYDCLVHHTAAPAESAEWIKNFTEHISTIPYRQERMNLHDAGFCMDVGQVKTGDSAEDTYVKMLQEMQRVTAPMAYGIATQFPDVKTLIRALKQDGPLMLQDVKKCVNKSGALSESRIGPAVSRRLHKVFTGLDPNATDV